ncbi:hypothetical protein CR513_16700, partial [Mucuna pruriens]
MVRKNILFKNHVHNFQSTEPRGIQVLLQNLLIPPLTKCKKRINTPVSFASRSFAPLKPWGTQNAHKNERILLNRKREYDNNVHLYPYSLPLMSNLPLQGTPYYHGVHMHPMVHLAMALTKGFPSHQTMVATSQWRLNPETAESASNSPVGGSSSGFGDLTLQESSRFTFSRARLVS